MTTSRIETLRLRILDLRRSSSLPWWRTSYADFLVERALEYVAVNRIPEAEGVLDRVERWIEQQESVLRKAKEGLVDTTPRQKFRPYTEEQLRTKLASLRSDLNTRRQMIPGPERESLLSRLDRVEKHLQSNWLEEAHSELNAVRVAWIRRLTRSYRAWSATTAPSAISRSSVANPAQRLDLVPTGPYNSRRNMDDVVSLVGERDPIWVEDFVELYNDLMQYVDRLGDPDKKKKGR